MLGQRLTPRQVRDLHERAATRGATRAAPWLQFDPGEMEAMYNRRPFIVRHRLPEHPMFQLEPLVRLCRRCPSDAINYRIGRIPIDSHFDASFTKRDLSLAEALDRIEETQAWIAIFNPERDPEYRPVIEGLVGEVALQTERLDPGMNWYSTYIFISAKDSVTPYHMDREMNFLLQVRGTKLVQLWDPADDDIMSPADRDRLMATPTRPGYREEFASKAMNFSLEPGLGVHHPFIAPHAVHTGAELSISLAVTFRTKASDVWSDAHRLNHRLRSVGLDPTRVGRNSAIDYGKALVLRTVRGARSLLDRDPNTGAAGEPA
ncbi:MAG TPA: cupin-like domain-containing protein [Burkholderiaceae bacterium]|nr:cupin-like domain-containing protein [Burkholderiaceae bacterium]